LDWRAMSKERRDAPPVDGLRLHAVNPDRPVPRGRCYSCRMRMHIALPCGLILAALLGCATTRVVMVGPARPPISPDRVQVFLQPPAVPYRQIANLTASSRGALTLTSGAKINKVIERLKSEAAKLGANGILLHGVGDQGSGSVGVGLSTESDSGHSPYGLGLGVWAFTNPKSGEADAIYLETH
jgi:hypothetical protein